MTSLGCHEGQRACGGLDRPEPSHVLECTQDHGCCPGLGHGHTVSHCFPSELELRALSLEVHQKSMDSSISLVHYIISSAQIWMITRYDLYHTLQPAFLLVMFLNIYEAFIMEIFIHLCSLGNWTAMYGPVCHRCQHALLGLVSQTFTHPFPASRLQCLESKKQITHTHMKAKFLYVK